MKPMKTNRTLLLIAGLLVMGPAVAPARAERKPMVVDGVSGNMHIFQSTPFPCSNIERDVPVIGGHFEIASSEGEGDGRGNRRFVMTRGTVRMRPFAVDFSCLGFEEHHQYTSVGVQVANAVSFVASPHSPGVYAFAIPPRDILLHQASIKNGAPEARDTHPARPVTGFIDLDAGTVRLQVVVGMRIRVDGLGEFDGSLTTDISGTIRFPDTDDDGVPDRTDNCPRVSNPSQGTVASPLIRAPGDVTLHSCLDTRIGRPVAADICENEPVTVSNDAPHPYPPGRTVVTWRATDSQSHVRTDTQTVTIDDTTPPVFTSVPADSTLIDCGPADLGLPTATDDCGRPVLTHDARPRFLPGTTVVTWTATDLSRNRAFATQHVTVDDQVRPQVACVPAANPSGQAPGHGGFFQVVAADRCERVTLRLGSYVLGIGETIKITETGQSGVRLVGVMGPHNIRHFHVGRGEAVLVATDGSGNTATAICPR